MDLVGSWVDTQPSETQDSDLQPLSHVDPNAPWGVLVSTSSPAIHQLIGETPVQIGRRSDSQIRHQEALISGRHCVLVHRDRRVWATDYSSNGTWIGEHRLDKGVATLINDRAELVLINGSKGRPKLSYWLYLTTAERPFPLNVYDVRDKLGAGAFAEVFFCVNRSSGDKAAVKVINKAKFAMTQPTARPGAINDEARILRQLDHPNIIKVYDVLETKENLYVVLELVKGGDLFDQIVGFGRPYPEGRARDILNQILRAVAYLHDRNIVHRDLKPENILLKRRCRPDDPQIDADCIKISDFGLSRMVGEGSFMKTLCGTPQYLAPEVLVGSSNIGYDKAVDIWSVGVILYILLSGSPPFDDSNQRVPLLEQVRQGLYSFPPSLWANVSPSGIDLVKRMLDLNPSKRISISEISRHPWMLGRRYLGPEPSAANHPHGAVRDMPPQSSPARPPHTRAGEGSASQYMDLDDVAEPDFSLRDPRAVSPDQLDLLQDHNSLEAKDGEEAHELKMHAGGPSTIANGVGAAISPPSESRRRNRQTMEEGDTGALTGKRQKTFHGMDDGAGGHDNDSDPGFKLSSLGVSREASDVSMGVHDETHGAAGKSEPLNGHSVPVHGGVRPTQ